MPAKSVPTGIHEEVESDEQWEQLLQKEGLIVIDVYPKWSGFCKALANNFKRLKNLSADGSVPLVFAAAQADSIEALKKYRGRCEPCFLMFGGGVMVGVERGVNVPCLNQIILEKLEDEVCIAAGTKERVEVTDPVIALLEEEERRLAEEAAEMEEVIETEVTFCIIKPDAVENGLAPDILARMAQDGITILRQEERLLTDEQARCIYGVYELQEIFEGLINYICSGNSILMAIARGDSGIIADFRELIGPPNVEEARQNNPDCYRALFGTTNYQNAIHGSDSIESACRELAFFFPDFTNPVRVKEKPKVETTLCIIRPEAVLEFVDDIREQILRLGFEIVVEKEVEMTEEMFEAFYTDLDKESDYYEILKEQMTCGISVVMMLRKLVGIEAFNEALGPKELPQPAEDNTEEEEVKEDDSKAKPDPEKFKKKKTTTETDLDLEDDEEQKEAPFVPLREAFRIAGIGINLIHGSSTAEEAHREIGFFWPLEHTFMLLKPGSDDHTQGVEKMLVDAGLVIAARKTMQLSREEVDKLYTRITEEEFYPTLQDYMTSGFVQVYLIAGNNAVERLRALQGPTDHDEALEKAPDSIRARFGTDTLRNSVHASSSLERAQEMMDLFFGTDLDFDEEGRLDLKAAIEKHHTRDESEITAKPSTKATAGDGIKEEDEDLPDIFDGMPQDELAGEAKAPEITEQNKDKKNSEEGSIVDNKQDSVAGPEEISDIPADSIQNNVPENTPAPEDVDNVPADAQNAAENTPAPEGADNVPSDAQDVPEGTPAPEGADNVPTEPQNAPEGADNVPTESPNAPEGVDDVPTEPQNAPEGVDNVPTETQDVPENTPAPEVNDDVPADGQNVPEDNADVPVDKPPSE